MPCELKESEDTTFLGTTLYSTGKCMGKLTAVYLPPKHLATDAVNVVIWLHGMEVDNIKTFFDKNEAHVRDTVLKSTKDVVLIVPWLGYKYWVAATATVKKHSEGSLSVDDMGNGKWGENYLDDVLSGLAQFQNSKKDASEKKDKPPPILIKNLVIACHSGGGTGMRNLVVTLGKHLPKLKGCWGFDCLNDSVDATFWFKWMQDQADRIPLWVFYGPSTLPQSVKLDLIGRGIATPEGTKVKSPAKELKNLHVIHSHYEAYMTGSSVNGAVDTILSGPPPIVPPPANGKKGDLFFEEVADKMLAYYAFPDGIHYYIARQFFLTQLRNADFLP